MKVTYKEILSQSVHFVGKYITGLAQASVYHLITVTRGAMRRGCNIRDRIVVVLARYLGIFRKTAGTVRRNKNLGLPIAVVQADWLIQPVSQSLGIPSPLSESSCDHFAKPRIY
jgi:hypothetical protein